MKSIQRVLGQYQRQNELNGLPCGEYTGRVDDPRMAIWKLEATVTKEEAAQFKADTLALLAKIKSREAI
jgi:hypothetical protein